MSQHETLARHGRVNGTAIGREVCSQAEVAAGKQRPLDAALEDAHVAISLLGKLVDHMEQVAMAAYLRPVNLAGEDVAQPPRGPMSPAVAAIHEFADRVRRIAGQVESINSRID